MTPGTSHSPIHYNLYRFGVDEVAVGKLINSDLPSDDEERWQILDAPRYHIQRLLDEHLRAQAALRDCRDGDRPFVLFLRSFSSEYHDRRIEGAISSSFSLQSVVFQDKVKFYLELGTPVVKLHGGSDGFYPGQTNDALILSTHAENWSTVAEELIRAASAIVFLVGRLTAGVVEEFDLIRKHDREGRCIVVLFDPDTAPGDSSGVRSGFPDFPNFFDDDPELMAPEVGRLLPSLIGDSRTEAPLEAALNLHFTYLEPVFVRSEDSACRLYEEALAVCEKRMQTEPGAIADLTRTQGWMALCLASMPEAGRDALEYAQRAATNLEKAVRVTPDRVAGLRPLVEEARRVTGKIA